jgi:DNA repair ATPase RecN
MLQKSLPGSSALISRSAEVRCRTSAYDRDLAELHRVVSAHHGYFDDLRTQSQTGKGRLLRVALAFPSADFDPALSDLKRIGRVVAVAEMGEDSTVRIASQERHLASTRDKLARLQKLRRDRTDKLPDVLELEKEISAANESLIEQSRSQEELKSTVA